MVAYIDSSSDNSGEIAKLSGSIRASHPAAIPGLNLKEGKI